MKSLGVMLILTAAVLAVIGVGLLFADRLPLLGRLPGDIHIEGKRWSFSFPLVTCIVVSLVLTLLINFFLRMLNR